MLAALIALWIPLRLIDFPVHPIAEEIEVGVKTYQVHKGLDRLYLDDRQVVGKWFDGRLRQDVDQVLWISPGLVSRWLGYLEAKEKWPEGELEARWARLRSNLGGKMTFVARLCAMPRKDILDEEPPRKPDPIDIQAVRFLWTSSLPEYPSRIEKEGLLSWSWPRTPPEGFGKRPISGLRFEPKAALLASRQAREAKDVLREDWWLRVPFGEPLTPEFALVPSGFEYPLGDFYSATFLVCLPIPQGALQGAQFELRMFSPRKERIARFSILDRRFPVRLR